MTTDNSDNQLEHPAKKIKTTHPTDNVVPQILNVDEPLKEPMETVATPVIAKIEPVIKNIEPVIAKIELILVEDKEKRLPTLDQRCVTENDVGITTFLHPELPCFSGLVKNRFADFHVYEVDSLGHVLHVTDSTIPEAPMMEEVIAETIDDDAPITDQSGLEALATYLPEETIANLRNLLVEPPTVDQVTAPLGDKGTRTAIHQVVKKFFGGKIASSTQEGLMCFQLMTSPKVDPREFGRKGRGNKGRSQRPNPRPKWPHEGNYLKFLLYKENKDTLDAINFIQRVLRLPGKAFSFAGTKDRRAITVQECRAFKITAETMSQVNTKINGMRVGNFSYVDEALKMGKLTGNRFIITLRGVTPDPSTIELSSIMDSFSNHGFINYFGLQRFGTRSLPTHWVGRELLKKDYKKAVYYLLTPREDDREARELWVHGDSKGALEGLHKSCIAEKAVLIHLTSGKTDEDKKAREKDFIGAILKIPRGLRTMYAHSYQSFVFNTVASKRIEVSGLKVVEGDLVLPVSELVNLEDDMAIEDAEDQVKEGTGEATGHKNFIVPIHIVTKEDVDQNLYTIHDIVLPIPGWAVTYPPNMESTYKEIMSADGIDHINLRSKQKDFDLPGGYRTLLSKPKDVSFRTTTYEDETVPLIQTDVDKMDNIVPTELKLGSNHALIIEMTLDRSVYATMALREITKVGSGRYDQNV